MPSGGDFIEFFGFRKKTNTADWTNDITVLNRTWNSAVFLFFSLFDKPRADGKQTGGINTAPLPIQEARSSYKPIGPPIS